MEEKKNIFLYLKILIQIILPEVIIYSKEVNKKIMLNLINLWVKWIGLNKEKLNNGEMNLLKIIINIKLFFEGFLEKII